MSPGFVPDQAKPQPPSVHSVNPSTAGRHVDVVAETDEYWFPLEALCAHCGQIITLLTQDGAWMQKNLTLPAQRIG
jgi:hypothetical protein